MYNDAEKDFLVGESLDNGAVIEKKLDGLSIEMPSCHVHSEKRGFYQTRGGTSTVCR